MSYKVWESNTVPGCCTLVDIENVERVFELNEGVERAGDFTEAAQLKMDPARPKNVKLPDQVYNRDKLLVVNEGIKTLVESMSIEDVEFLPVSLINHKGRRVEAEYWILNPLRVVDCIDLEASDYKWNRIDPDKMASCDELVLREESIPRECALFRLGRFPRVVVANAALADALEEQNFAGVDLVEIDEFES